MNDIYKSATLKLTVWYLALVMTISLMFSAVVYHFATDTLAHGLDSQQARIYREFPVFTNNPFFIKNNDVEQGAHRILINLLYFNIIVLIGAGYASYWLAKRTLEPIETSNERQKRFVADASHELRTPLTALKMDTEVALMDLNASKTELRTALQSNLEEADRLNLLLNNLLKLGQLDSNAVQYNFDNLYANDVVVSAVRDIEQRAKSKHLTITISTGKDHIYGDRDSLVQLLVILLDNAVKYSPEVSEIKVSSIKKGESTEILIADQGRGIAPDALAHAFDRFYREDRSRTGKDGYGLGLSIAKQIADIHHASITLSSVVGKGTRALVSIPNKPSRDNK